MYAMTKAAINQLTKNLACEWAKDGIRVNTVAPWYTATPLANQVIIKGEGTYRVNCQGLLFWHQRDGSLGLL